MKSFTRMNSVLSGAKSILDGIMTVAVLIVAGLVIRNQFQAHAQPMPAGGESAFVQMNGERLTADRIRHKKGTSRNVIVEFSDFECPYCGQHANDALPQLTRELVDSGKASYVFVNFPLETIHRNALKAAEAAECAQSQEQFWSIHDQLFKSQKELTAADLLRHAQAAGLDMERFSECISHPPTVTIRADLDAGKQLGVMGTPTFFIGTLADDGSVTVSRRLQGAASTQAFSAAIGELGKVRTWFHWPWESAA